MIMTLLIIIVCVTDNHIYFPFVVHVITCRSIPHSLLIAGGVAIVTRLVPLVEQELSTLQGPRVRYSTNKIDRHDITELLLKVALNTINQSPVIVLFKMINKLYFLFQ